MVVNKLFSKVKLPTDENEINHMINEYDKQINQQISNIEKSMITTSKVGNLFLLFFYFLIGIIILTNNDMFSFSVIIKVIYTIPLFIFGVYSIILERRIRSKDIIDKKLVCKYNIIMIISMCAFLFNATVIFQKILFPKWGNKEYIIILLIILLVCLIFVIIAKFESPRKFIKEFVYSERTYKNITTLSNSILIIAIIIANITKPYRILLFASYVIVIILFQVILYSIYKYSQYDYIEDLKNSKSRKRLNC